MHNVCKKTRVLLSEKTKAEKVLSKKKDHQSAFHLQEVNKQLKAHLTQLGDDLMVIEGGRV